MTGSSLGTKAISAREAIADLCADPPSAPELVDEVAERVRRIVPYDSGAWMTTDPVTMLPTGIARTGDGGPEMSRAFAEAELLRPGSDVNTFDVMARIGLSAAGLVLTTGGDVASSRRHREVHQVFGLHDELRVVARSANTTWALGCVSRADDLPDFSEEEVRWAGSIADHLGDGLRIALSRPQTSTEQMRGPGMLVLNAAGEIEAATGEAERWLATLDALPGELPIPVAAAAMQAKAIDTGTGMEQVARLRVQVPGGWLLIHADVLRQAGEAASKVAVVLERADRAALVPLLLALHGLTGREREVAELLVSGLSTDEIAGRMNISRHTLRDHTKAIFAKVGVTSRPELTAALGQEPLAA